MYRLVSGTNCVVERIEDHAFIPNSATNRDWQDYQTWIDNGNEPEEAVPVERES